MKSMTNLNPDCLDTCRLEMACGEPATVNMTFVLSNTEALKVEIRMELSFPSQSHRKQAEGIMNEADSGGWRFLMRKVLPMKRRHPPISEFLALDKSSHKNYHDFSDSGVWQLASSNPVFCSSRL